MENKLLKDATRDELIEELKNRESITSIRINNGEGGNILTKSGRLSFDGETWIFAIKPNYSTYISDIL